MTTKMAWENISLSLLDTHLLLSDDMLLFVETEKSFKYYVY